MTFYLKYRPQTLEELDLTSVRESLKKLVAAGNLPHAFLFSGPKGTGKTSAARIIAKIINCESKKTPCGKCGQCKSISKGTNIDVIEIDAASHRGIDDIRILKEVANLAPARAKKKVYIIDEAHMLTTEASNALLKTLEEPPSHVMFILATTNPEKLIATIRSRATNIIFKKATPEEIVRSLQRVAKGEKIKIADASLKIIAKAANGSFRDAVKILDQLVAEKIPLEPEAIEKFSLAIGVNKIEEFLSLLAKKEVKKALYEIERSVSLGTAVDNLLAELLTRLRLGILAKVGVGEDDLPAFSKNELVELIELFSKAAGELRDCPIEQLPVELAVIKWCKDAPAVEEKKQLIESEVQKRQVQPLKEKVSAITDDIWKSILAHVRPINTSIEALLRAAKPIAFDGRVLTLGVYYRFHKERLEEGSHRRVLEEVVAEVLGNPIRILCTLTEPPQKAVPVEPAPESATSVLTPSDGVLTEGEDKDIIKIAEEIFGN